MASSGAPIATTRTSSPYFSPNSAIAPSFTAASGVISRVVTSAFSRMRAFTSRSTAASSAGVTGRGLRDVEAQPIRRVQAALLHDMLAQMPPQRLMQQMRRRVVGRGSRRAGS